MRSWYAGLLLLLLASCAVPSEPAVSTLQSGAVSNVSTIRPTEGNCREYRAPATIGGKEQEVYGKACQQADGTWQLVPPPEAQEGASPMASPPTAIYPAYGYYDPWGPPWWGPSFGLFGSFGFSHHHHFHHRHFRHR